MYNILYNILKYILYIDTHIIYKHIHTYTWGKKRVNEKMKKATIYQALF